MLKKFNYRNLLQKQYILLERSDIHVWLIDWQKIKKYALSKLQFLSQAEINEIDKLKAYDDKMRSLIGKIALIDLAEFYFGLNHNQFQIKKDNYGKPYLDSKLNKDTIQFNISHSKDYVMIAFCRCQRLGVDIEAVKQIKDYRDLARHFYCLQEYASVKNVIDFLQIWTKKEAYLKALGVGLYKELNSFSILGNKIEDHGYILNKWYITEVKVNQGYVANIVVNI